MEHTVLHRADLTSNRLKSVIQYGVYLFYDWHNHCLQKALLLCFILFDTGKLLFIYNLVHIGYKEDELSVEFEISIYELYSSSITLWIILDFF